MKSLAVLILILAHCVPAMAEEPAVPYAIQAAQTLFARFELLNSKFDPTVESLYSDRAVISIVVLPRRPGQETTMTQTVGLVYRTMLVTSMSTAKARGDANLFRKLTFKELSSTSVEVRGTRVSTLRSYATPFVMEISYLEGRWFITKEMVEILNDK